MKKRTKRVLSAGVAALMAISTLPLSALPVDALINSSQTANGGTPYTFILEDAETGENTVYISSEDVATSNVSRTMNLYIDSEEWSSDNFINNATINWATTDGAKLEDGGTVDSDIYYKNVFDPTSSTTAGSVVIGQNADGEDVTVMNTKYVNSIYCLANLLDSDMTMLYTDCKCMTATKAVAYDKIFGAELQYVGTDQVQFTYTYIS